MLDKTHGWALTQSAILNTVDGGLHWQNVTPANAKLNSMSTGVFLNAQNAWIVTPQGVQKSISLLQNTDGGKNWQSSTIQAPEIVSTAMLHFLNASNGWLQVLGEPGSVGKSGLGGRPLFIFQTTDGGQRWKQLASPNPKDIPDPSGISFSDMQTGWEAGDNPTASMSGTINNAQPLLVVTHDGGKTWKSQPLPVLRGVGKSDMVSTRPPVFFGKNGLLPVVDQIVPPRDSKSKPGIGLNLYMTQNGGQTWTPTKLVTNNGLGLSSFTFYIADMQHAWVVSGTNLYATSNSGQSWTKLPPTPQPISELSFVNANDGWAIGSTNVTPGNTKDQPPSLLHTTNGGRTWQPINYSIVGKPITTSTNGGR
jgi:photosystem II stability/assembly factor-like uncharacterized protein